MSERKLKLLLLVAYSIPYSFLAVWWDAATTGNLFFYILMIPVLAFLGRFSISRGLHWIMFTGNALSFLISAVCARPFLSSIRWKWYFEEVPGQQIIFLLSVSVFLLELTAIWKKENLLKSFTFWSVTVSILVIFYNLKGWDDYNLFMIGLNPVLAFCSGIKECRNWVKQFPGLWHLLSLATMTIYGTILDGFKILIRFISTH